MEGEVKKVMDISDMDIMVDAVGVVVVVVSACVCRLSMIPVCVLLCPLTMTEGDDDGWQCRERYSSCKCLGFD